MALKWKEIELENYIWENPNKFFEAVYPWEKNIDRLGIFRLGRQVGCNTGIVDMMFANAQRLYIVEAKAVKADDHALGQLTRYEYEAKHLMEDKIWHGDYGIDVQSEWLRVRDEGLYVFHKIIVAPSFEKTMMRITAAEDEELSFVRARESNGEFDFELDRENETPYADKSYQTGVSTSPMYNMIIAAAEETASALKRSAKARREMGFQRMIVDGVTTPPIRTIEATVRAGRGES